MEKRPLKKLIVTDDDEDILEITKICLQDMEGVAIKYCTSGQDTIQEALQFLPDMCLLDVMMPNMDGLTTMDLLHKFPALAKMPCVFLTARVYGDEVANYLKAGAFDVIVKPFDPIKLPQLILTLWDKYQSIQNGQ